MAGLGLGALALRPFEKLGLPPFPTAERQRFANGLDVLVVPLRRLPIATALLMSDAGAECDAVTLSGVASLTAEALAEGTRSRDAVSLAAQIARLLGDPPRAASLAAEARRRVALSHDLERTSRELARKLGEVAA